MARISSDRIFSVFVSSTYRDLIPEREAAMKVLLEHNCLPIGMERFPAASRSAFEIIKKKIDICDIYILIIGGRYGSMLNDVISYTEAEYLYAIEKGKPVLAFVHGDPDSLPRRHTDEEPERRELLARFRTSLRTLYKEFLTTDQLAIAVGASIANQIRDLPTAGWTRAQHAQQREFVSMIECFKDAARQIEVEAQTPTLTLDLLALDLSHAADYVKYWMEIPKISDFRLRAVVMTDDPARIAAEPLSLPPAVHRWCEKVDKSLSEIRSYMQQKDAEMQSAGRSFHGIVKKHNSFPSIHGWTLHAPVKRHSVSFCWWDAGDIDWGQQTYLSIAHEDHDGISRHFSRALDGAFSALWQKSQVLAFDQHCGSWPNNQDFYRWLQGNGGSMPSGDEVGDLATNLLEVMRSQDKDRRLSDNRSWTE